MGTNHVQCISALAETEHNTRNPGKWRRSAPLGALAGLLILGGQTVPLASAETDGIGETGAGDIGPIGSWGSDLVPFLEGNEEDAEDAVMLVGASNGPLPIIGRLLLAPELDAIEDRIDAILDPNQYPSLTPADAGEIDVSYAPSLLSDFAGDVHELSEAALIELQSGDPDHEVLGTKLKTIRSLLDDYRLLAGIDLLENKLDN